MPANYRDIRFFQHEGLVGFPQVTLGPANTVLISTTTGRLIVFDMETERVVQEVFMGEMGGLACSNLGRPVVSDDLKECWVATHGGYAALWRIGEATITKLRPKRSSPVASFLNLPTTFEQRYALGLGWYPLGGDHAQASLEIWAQTDSGPEFINEVKLPGACADVIAVDEDNEQLIVGVGLRSQRGGFIVRLDLHSQAVISFQEVPFHFFRGITPLPQFGEQFLLGASHCALFTSQKGFDEEYEFRRVTFEKQFATYFIDANAESVICSNARYIRSRYQKSERLTYQGWTGLRTHAAGSLA